MILVGGSAANPPTLAGHGEVLAAVARYEKDAGASIVIWIPSGTRKDKSTLPIALRRRMIELSFPPEWCRSQAVPIWIDYSEMEGETLPTIEWFRRLAIQYPDQKVVWYTGVDSVVPRDENGGRSDIESWWHEGVRMWSDPQYAFLILPRRGYPHPSRLRLPEHFRWIEVDLPEVSSSVVRNLIQAGEALPQGIVHPEVEVLLRRHFNQYPMQIGGNAS